MQGQEEQEFYSHPPLHSLISSSVCRDFRRIFVCLSNAGHDSSCSLEDEDIVSTKSSCSCTPTSASSCFSGLGVGGSLLRLCVSWCWCFRDFFFLGWFTAGKGVVDGCNRRFSKSAPKFLATAETSSSNPLALGFCCSVAQEAAAWWGQTWVGW